MKFITSLKSNLSRRKQALTFLALSFIASPAFAQLERGTSMLESVSTWLLSIGGIVFTIAMMFVGYQMMFRAAQWKEVAPIFWGGVLVAGASGIAALFF